MIAQNLLIKELLALRQTEGAVAVAAVETEFQRRLSITRDEWFRLLASVDTERLKQLDTIWAKQATPKMPIAPTAVTPAQITVPSASIYPQNGWLGEYLNNFAQNMESPDSYIFWSGIATLSAVVRRKVWVRWGEGRIFPNFYIIFVSKAGTARKGPPIKAAEHFAKTILDVNILDRTTTERFPHDLSYRMQSSPTGGTQKVSTDAQGFVCAEELVTFLDDQTYNSGILKFLIKWWDCQDDDATRSHKHGIVQL